mmetsp:Transcript_18513/g.45434  ORF Transcript_18513/g.45434 Transcript_18513/m.45434 type:complete len:255 (-) Transcript_18513:373-1137(-)
MPLPNVGDAFGDTIFDFASDVGVEIKARVGFLMLEDTSREFGFGVSTLSVGLDGADGGGRLGTVLSVDTDSLTFEMRASRFPRVFVVSRNIFSIEPRLDDIDPLLSFSIPFCCLLVCSLSPTGEGCPSSELIPLKFDGDLFFVLNTASLLSFLAFFSNPESNVRSRLSFLSSPFLVSTLGDGGTRSVVSIQCFAMTEYAFIYRRTMEISKCTAVMLVQTATAAIRKENQLIWSVERAPIIEIMETMMKIIPTAR